MKAQKNQIKVIARFFDGESESLCLEVLDLNPNRSNPFRKILSEEQLNQVWTRVEKRYFNERKMDERTFQSLSDLHDEQSGHVYF